MKFFRITRTSNVHFVVLTWAMVFGSALIVTANEPTSGSSQSDVQAVNEAAPPAAPPGPQFGGCCDERTKLTGDWDGCRNCYAQQGITFDYDNTFYYYGVTSGGLEQRFDFGGRGDYVTNFDLGKLGVQEGLYLKLRAEHRFGQDINAETGAILPATIGTSIPFADNDQIVLSNVLLTQMVSENFAVFAGKLDTLDGDTNAFASKRGKDQFSNVGFVANPALLRTVPYSTLGTGFIILDEHVPVFSFSVLDTHNSVGTSGFEDLFADGVVLNAEYRRKTDYFCLPGHQLFGGVWSSQTFTTLGQDPRVILPNVPIAQQDGSWGLYFNFDQYMALYSDKSPAGWGVFGRAGITDDQTNPIAYFLSTGIGGNSPICGREMDQYGIGWYYVASSNEIGPLLTGLLGPVGDGQVVELFYNYQVNPWFHITPDIQIIDPSRESVDTSLVVGLRAKLDY